MTEKLKINKDAAKRIKARLKKEGVNIQSTETIKRKRMIEKLEKGPLNKYLDKA